MSKKVIVVGAGIAGLTSAVYLRRSGFDVTLVEQHSIVGGMCTSWKRVNNQIKTSHTIKLKA
jgi:phytoene dehydrogenase-like protein